MSEDLDFCPRATVWFSRRDTPTEKLKEIKSLLNRELPGLKVFKWAIEYDFPAAHSYGYSFYLKADRRKRSTNTPYELLLLETSSLIQKKFPEVKKVEFSPKQIYTPLQK